jgi:hypothetical protein
MRRVLHWEAVAALACGALCLLPVVRVPAGIALLFLLPGMAICRHWIGTHSPVRLVILGSVFSLASVPVVSIPLALATGKPTFWTAVCSAAAITLIASLTSRRAAEPPQAPLDWRPLAAIAAIALVMQIWISFEIFPEPDTIRWKGLPDLIFFKGISAQLAHRVPPMDPENGGQLLIHNWIYHFHFVQLEKATGLSTFVSQRVASAWLALGLLGIIYMLAADRLGSRIAAVAACAFIMSSGEVYWLVRSVARMQLSLTPLPWGQGPFGLTLLFGWYNLAPLCAGTAAWYCFERSRPRRGRGWLWGSIFLCTAMAFFHPVFYGIFMTAFCLWLMGLWAKTRLRPAWLAYLLTPVPFFLLYKLPYYGWSLPPRVVGLDLSLAGLLDRGQDLVLWGGILMVAGGLGLRAARHGFLVILSLLSVALALFVESPNPHWFRDLLYLALALAAGMGLSSFWRVRPAITWAAGGMALAVALLALGLHLETALSEGHTWSNSERAAAAWLRLNSGPDDLVAIHPNSRSSYTVIGLADRRVIHGWTGHLLDFKSDAREQERDVAALYASGNPEEAASLARRYGARYIYVGPDERALLGPGRLPDRCFRLAWAAGDVEIYRPACTAETPMSEAEEMSVRRRSPGSP